MFRIIISNLWRQRSKNVWLFIELIIVTILSWIIADPTVIGLYDLLSDQGYDTDRIVNIEIGKLPTFAAAYGDITDGLNNNEEALNKILPRLIDMPEVEYATCVFYSSNPGCEKFNTISGPEWITDDSIKLSSPLISIYNADFFKVYGIEAAEGYPSVDELMSKQLGFNDYIITESLNRKLWGDKPGLIDKYLVDYVDYDDYIDTVRYNIVGVVKDFHINSYTRSTMNVIHPRIFGETEYQPTPIIVIRLKEGINADSFTKDRHEELSDLFSSGHLYVRSISTQKAYLSRSEAIMGVTSQRTMSLLIAGLFLINLIIGVIGCVWLQTGKRIKEVGVLRSYGAARSNITGMLIGESVVMATVAIIIGCTIYLQYAVKEGLSDGVINMTFLMQQETWITDFHTHFAIISAIVYVIIIACVVIGTYFPARHVSRIEPVDALRDE